MKNQKLKKSFRALPTMGMAFIVLGVLLLAALLPFLHFHLHCTANLTMSRLLRLILIFLISRILCLSFRLINPGLAQSTCNPCHEY